jgi:hypothetical protein
MPTNSRKKKGRNLQPVSPLPTIFTYVVLFDRIRKKQLFPFNLVIGDHLLAAG